MRGGAHPKKRGGRPKANGSHSRPRSEPPHLLQEFTAGDPMREGVLWTNCHCAIITTAVGWATPASRRTIRRC